MLSPQLLELLRAWWREGRRRSPLLPGGWLFPGRNPVEPLSARQLCRAVRAAAQAAGIKKPPLQSGPIPGYIRGILKALRERRDAVRPGDVIMHNDAYGGASRGPDVGFAVPVFRDGRLVGFAATTAHHLDIGALSPGSCGIVDAIDAYAEGLQFKAIKVYDRGVRNDAVWQLLRDNIRVSDLVVGDMEAALAARVPSRPFCDFRAAKSSSQRTLCWREMDSNFCCRVCDYAELPRCSEMLRIGLGFA
jgi:hypothetical protein